MRVNGEAIGFALLYGYMNEAISLMTKYAKDNLGLCQLVADVHSNNKRAQQLFGKLGFHRDTPCRG